MLKLGYNEKNISKYDRSYFEEIEAKRWRAIQKRKLLIDGILEEVYTTLSSDRYKIVLPPIEGHHREKTLILVCGHYKGEFVCLDYFDPYSRHLRINKPYIEKSYNFAYCLPEEELALYVYSEEIKKEIRDIIRLRLERKIDIEVVKDNDLIRKYYTAKILLDRQNRYITSCTYILQNFIKGSIELSYEYMRWYDPQRSQEPIVTLSFSGRTYLYHAGKFIYTPEENMYTINREEDHWKMKKTNEEII